MNSTTELRKVWAERNAHVVREVGGSSDPKKSPPGIMKDAAGRDVVETGSDGREMLVEVPYAILDVFVAEGLAKEGWGAGVNQRVYTLTARGRTF